MFNGQGLNEEDGTETGDISGILKNTRNDKMVKMVSTFYQTYQFIKVFINYKTK